MKTILVREGQTLADIAIQEYGCIEGLMLLVDDNNLSMDSDVYKDQPLEIRELPELTADNKKVVQNLIELNKVPNSQIIVEQPETAHYVTDGYVQTGYVK